MKDDDDAIAMTMAIDDGAHDFQIRYLTWRAGLCLGFFVDALATE